MFLGMTSKPQTNAIFDHLDSHFEDYYPLKWGPMYVAPAFHNEKSVITCSTTPWLGFLDVYLRCKQGREPNRSAIFSLLMKHTYDISAAPFTEGAGIDGHLTGGAGRAWDNGSFFHCLLSGIYGIEKTSRGIRVSDPVTLESCTVTELKNVRWRDASYDFRWTGEGSKISKLSIDSTEQSPARVKGRSMIYLLTQTGGSHHVEIVLSR